MPKTITYYQCDQDKGHLKKIAETKHKFGTACGDGGTNAEFWECVECGAIYIRHRDSSGSPVGNDPDTYSDFYLFTGKATREELLEFIPLCNGYYDQHLDNRIVVTRMQKLDTIKSKKDILKSGTSLTSVVVRSKFIGDSKKVGDDGLEMRFIELLGTPSIVVWCKAGDINQNDQIILMKEKISFPIDSSVDCYFIIPNTN